jgi:hypothetical protein
MRLATTIMRSLRSRTRSANAASSPPRSRDKSWSSRASSALPLCACPEGGAELEVVDLDAGHAFAPRGYHADSSASREGAGPWPRVGAAPSRGFALCDVAGDRDRVSRQAPLIASRRTSG